MQRDPGEQTQDSAQAGEQLHGDAGGVSSVWWRTRRVTPRQTAPLSRERIVGEAVALLDQEGTGRLTMRRLAERLEAGATTLYWHVDTKDDVLDLALDAVFGEVALPEPASGEHWRAVLSGFLHHWRAVLLEHPWSAPLLGTRPLLGPNALARSEFLHSTLLTAGIPEVHLTSAAYGLSNYVIGSATTRAAWHANGNESATRRAAGKHLQTHRANYPVQAQYLAMTDQNWEASFTRGLDYLLDGLEAHTREPALSDADRHASGS